MGGIISDTRSETVNKVPFLGDIPILGYFFKTKTTSRTKSEVIMLVTPRIIYSEEDIDAVRREIIGRMNLLDEGQTGRYEN
jgi:general secretion pathway protein D